ncbi:N-terminal acetyltransferase A complex subunit Nat1p [[Candida] railenensis]|uniref:N-terminal acetyltransferase A complex subunit Nat1p n=1 Tax=[Candida] railenensis TaxID=45579 RepID=A0A9P0QMC1_9ASCO|nr:N-terminal acetyltransferase A complex subunit Nat1p [[Candida] railenensis]
MSMRKATPILGSKEDIAFREALKLYDAKQYKKALKLVDQNLKKNSNHPESLTLKGCIIYFTGTKTEADLYVRKGLARSPTNHLVNHLAGIYFRNVENYAEAAKWYKAAIDNGSQNKQILRDLSTMQVQIRDYKNLKESRQLYLEEQPGFRANWTASAVAQHLNKNYDGAVSTLSKIEGLIKEHLSESDKVEHSECLLYKNSIISEAGNFGKALSTLEADEPEIKDKLSVLEYKARYLMLLGKLEEASKIYRILLQRNPDNAGYYSLLEVCLDTASKPVEIRLKLFSKLQKFYPRSDPPKFLPLTFVPADHPKFIELAKSYILPQLEKGVPSSFINIKPLYKDKLKLKAIESILLEFYNQKLNDKSVQPTIIVWTKYFLAQHYLYLNDLVTADRYIDEAITHSPTLVELYIIKARILKHKGEFIQASEVMNEGRELDLQDRFINSKATKYYFRANNVDKAIDTISLFTKLEEDAVNGCKDLHLMQASWVLIESAEAYARLYRELEKAKLSNEDADSEGADENEDDEDVDEKIELYKGLALKRFHAVLKLFEIFYNDQLDFHSYCMRRGTPRDYIETIKWEDNLHSTPIYSRVMKGLSKIYLDIYEQQQAAKLKAASAASTSSGSKNKKNKKKKSKAQGKKREELAAKVASEKEDQDPFGTTLLNNVVSNGNGKVLDNLFELFKPLLVEAKDNRFTWELAFELYVRQSKYVLAMQAIKNLNSVYTNYNGDNKKYKQIGDMVLRLKETTKNDPEANVAIVKVVEKGLATAFPDLTKGDEEFMQAYID